MADLTSYRHSQRTREVLRGLVTVVCPPDASELGISETIVDHVELSMRSLPALARGLLVTGLRAYDLSAMVWPRHLMVRACRLNPSLAEQWFLCWRHSRLAPFRQLAKGAKGLLCLAYYEMPEVRRQIGYTPEDWISRVSSKRQLLHATVIRNQVERLTEPDPMIFRGELS